MEFHPLKFITLSKEANQDAKGDLIKKVFFIREEKDEKLCSIDGEDFLSFQQIKDCFGISPTIFLNQISRKKTHFLDKNEITHFIENLSPEMEKLSDGQKRLNMNEEIAAKCKSTNHIQNSYNILTKKKVTFPKTKEIDLENDQDLLEISQNSFVSQYVKNERPSTGNDLCQPIKKKTKQSRCRYPWGWPKNLIFDQKMCRKSIINLLDMENREEQFQLALEFCDHPHDQPLTKEEFEILCEICDIPEIIEILLPEVEK